MSSSSSKKVDKVYNQKTFPVYLFYTNLADHLSLVF